MKYEAKHYSPDFTVKYLGRSHISFITLSSWSKFHLSVIFGSVVMTNFVYEGFVRNPKRKKKKKKIPQGFREINWKFRMGVQWTTKIPNVLRALEGGRGVWGVEIE